MTIRSDFGLYEVQPVSIKERVTKESLKADTETINSRRAIGIEVELENHKLKVVPNGHVWNPVGDGSLRNHGEEYVTQPIFAEEAPIALYELLQVCLHESCCFGPRTSTHVHVNAQDLNQDQVKRIVQIYCVFENALFNFVGKGRKKNIFCVPVCETNLLREFNSHNLNYITERWSKYTALNLLPLRDKGTLEFRHMHGSSNHVKLSQWIRLLLRMFDYVTDEKFDSKEMDEFITNMTGKANIAGFMRQVFKEDTSILPYTSVADFESCALAMHQMFSLNRAVTGLSTARVLEAPFYQFQGAA